MCVGLWLYVKYEQAQRDSMCWWWTISTFQRVEKSKVHKDVLYNEMLDEGWRRSMIASWRIGVIEPKHIITENHVQLGQYYCASSQSDLKDQIMIA